MKALQHLDGVGHRFRRQQSGLEYRRAEASDLAVFVLYPQAAAGEAGDLQPGGVRPDVHRREKRHGLRLYKRNLRK